MSNFNKARAYSSKHLTPNQIKKIQQMLKYGTNDKARYGNNAKEYYNGEINGNYDEALFNAITQYQRDNNLADDGMWGVQTNKVHGVLQGTRDNGTFRGHEDQYGDNRKVEKQKPRSQYSVWQEQYEYGIQNPEWFWGSSPEAIKIREGMPDAMKETIYDNTPDEIRATIDPRSLTRNQVQTIFNDNITSGTNAAAPYVAGALAAPVALGEAIFAPLATGGAALGSYILGSEGSRQGRRVGEDIGTGKQNYSYTSYDFSGAPVSVVEPDASNVYGDRGEAIGTAVGSTLGAIAGGYAGNQFATGKWGWQGRPGASSEYNWNGTNANGTTTVYSETPGQVVNNTSSAKGVARTTASRGHHGSGTGKPGKRVQEMRESQRETVRNTRKTHTSGSYGSGHKPGMRKKSVTKLGRRMQYGGMIDYSIDLVPENIIDLNLKSIF